MAPPRPPFNSRARCVPHLCGRAPDSFASLDNHIRRYTHTRYHSRISHSVSSSDGHQEMDQEKPLLFPYTAAGPRMCGRGSRSPPLFLSILIEHLDRSGDWSVLSGAALLLRFSACSGSCSPYTRHAAPSRASESTSSDFAPHVWTGGVYRLRDVGKWARQLPPPAREGAPTCTSTRPPHPLVHCRCAPAGFWRRRASASKPLRPSCRGTQYARRSWSS